MFPEELAEKIIQNKIVSNLGPIIKNTSHIKILEPYIHIVTLVCQKLAPKDFSVHILPLIELHRNGSRNMRLRCYRLLYNSLEESILAAS